MNRDDAVIDDFGDEWTRFDQAGLPEHHLERIVGDYFAAFPWDELPADAVGVDVGCGTGRWADWVAGRVGQLTCIDASPQAVSVATRRLARHDHCQVILASVDAMPIEPGTMDFVYSLGVLHHVPDTEAAIRDCAALLKPGGILYLYLYYSFENRPTWYRAVWRLSDLGRSLVSRLPRPIKNLVCDVIAVTIYWPLARLARGVERLWANPSSLPLSSYRDLGLYSMRTDARDRFGTRLEKRFARAEVIALLTGAGLVDVEVPTSFPYWIGIGRRPSPDPDDAAGDDRQASEPS